MKIVPSILAYDMNDFLSLIRQAESFASYVQIDLMDGRFVPTRSIPPSAISSLATSLSFEVHLMFRDPASAIAEIGHPGLKKVIFHMESDGSHSAIVSQLRDRRIGVGLAVNPGTGIERIGELAGDGDTILFMTVDPGRYGSPFKREVVEKVAAARRLLSGKIIAVDGGISLDNLALFVDAGVDYACVGSRIFLGGSPSENYRNFMHRLNRLEETKK